MWTGIACGDSTGPKAALSDAEFTAMLDAFSNIGVSQVGAPDTFVWRSVRNTERVAAQMVRASATSTTVTTTDDTTITCAGGGTSHITGTSTSTTSLDGQTMSGSGTATLSLTHCTVMASTGEEFTFDGDPRLTETVTMSFTPTASSFVVHLGGGLRWTLNGKSGTCAFDATVTATDQASSSVVTGTVCGRPAPQSFAGG